jgi:predicted DNA-binding transcriptional regulator YafY
MSDFLKKTKRQIEIAALTTAYPCKFSTQDMEDMFECNSVTIQRDLSTLRKRGVDIHSVPNEGLKVTSPLQEDTVNELIDDYVYVGVPTALSQKSNHFLTTVLKEKSFSFLALLNMACREKIEIKIKYKKTAEKRLTDKRLQPLLLFERENEWRLLAKEADKVKQFLLSKITAIEMTEKNFTIPEELNAQLLLDNSFGAWTSHENHKVKLMFTPQWIASGKIPLLMEKQTIDYQKDGLVMVSFCVNSLEDVARWVAGRGGEVIAQEPEELISLVTKISKNNIIAHQK